MKNAKCFSTLLLLIILLILSACSDEAQIVREDSPHNSNSQMTQSEGEIREPVKQSPSEPPQEPDEQPALKPPDSGSGASFVELYAPIIDAYARLEQSGFILSDEEIINESLVEIELDWGVLLSESITENKQWIFSNFDLDELPKLMYSLHDMSNGYRPESPELLVGVEINGIVEIISVYAIERFSVNSDFETDNLDSGVRAVFGVSNRNIISTALTQHVDGRAVVFSTWHGNVGETYEYFEIVGSAIGVGWLGMVLTVDPQQRFTVCYIGPCDYCDEGYNRISEEEYLELIHKFGTEGHDVGGIFEARHVSLEWKPVIINP
jgi:hypothetical protein